MRPLYHKHTCFQLFKTVLVDKRSGWHLCFLDRHQRQLPRAPKGHERRHSFKRGACRSSADECVVLPARTHEGYHQPTCLQILHAIRTSTASTAELSKVSIRRPTNQSWRVHLFHIKQWQRCRLQPWRRGCIGRHGHTCFELGKFKRCAIEKRKQYPANASTGMKKGDGRVLHFLAQRTVTAEPGAIPL